MQVSSVEGLVPLCTSDDFLHHKGHFGLVLAEFPVLSESTSQCDDLVPTLYTSKSPSECSGNKGYRIWSYVLYWPGQGRDGVEYLVAPFHL